jgi:hypothetical protein
VADISPPFITASVNDWWLAALTGSLSIRLIVVGIAALLLCGLAWRALHRSRPETDRQGFTLKEVRQRLRDDRGVATVEFVMVFPVALLTVLVLLQTTLMMAGNLFVHYAAFAATRTAIVVAPTGDRGGGGVLIQDQGNAFARVERSAAVAMAPVSGKIDAGAEGSQFASGLSQYFEAYGQTPPNWVDNLAGQRLNYALRHTRTTVFDTRFVEGDLELSALNEGQGITLGPKDPVTIGVGHRLHLSIPYASALFADGSHATAGGNTAYANITATATLTLEGYDRNLPPRPEVDRDP